MNDDTLEVKRLGSIFGHEGGSFAGLVYDMRGISPTINTAQGGLRMPLILEVKDDTDKWEYNKNTSGDK